MAKVEIEVEINASPEQVRAVVCDFRTSMLVLPLITAQVMDFDNYPQWHTSFFKSLEPIPSDKEPLTMSSGDRLNADFGNTTVSLVIVTNTPSEFRWKGSILAGAFSGEHYFVFKENKEKAGCCKFVHGENYDGWMSWLFGEGIGGVARKGVEKMYKDYCDDVKRRVESTK
jgi:hypothetical protein